MHSSQTKVFEPFRKAGTRPRTVRRRRRSISILSGAGLVQYVLTFDHDSGTCLSRKRKKIHNLYNICSLCCELLKLINCTKYGKLPSSLMSHISNSHSGP